MKKCLTLLGRFRNVLPSLYRVRIQLQKAIFCTFLLAASFHSFAAYMLSDLTVDKYLAQETQGTLALPNSGENSEKNWVASIIGVDAADLVFDKTDLTEDPPSPWILAEGASNTDVFYFDLIGEPTYFLLKLGNLDPKNSYGTPIPTHFLFENLAETVSLDPEQPALGLAVVDFRQDIYGKIPDITDDQLASLTIDLFKVSHISEFTSNDPPSDPPLETPAPGTLAMLLLGGSFIAISRRRRIRAL